MIIVKQFGNNCPGFNVQCRPYFEKEEESSLYNLSDEFPKST